jgi:hypothetical protein
MMPLAFPSIEAPVQMDHLFRTRSLQKIVNVLSDVDDFITAIQTSDRSMSRIGLA